MAVDTSRTVESGVAWEVDRLRDLRDGDGGGRTYCGKAGKGGDEKCGEHVGWLCLVSFF